MELEDKIKEYLENKMSEDKRTAFEQKIASDDELREEVSFQKEMYSFFDQREEVNTLKDLLKDSENDYFKNNAPEVEKKKVNVLFWILPAVILFVVIIYFMSNNGKTDKLSLDNIEVQKSENTQSDDVQVESSNGVKEDAEDTNIEENQSDNPTELDQKELPDHFKGQPIADASVGNYKTNPALESILTTSFRADQSVELSSPNASTNFKLKDGKVLFSLNGKTNKAGKLKLAIYDNDQKSFNEDLKTLELELFPVEQGDKDYQISFQGNIPVKKGLYYFIIMNLESDGLLYASKFEVK